MALETFSVVSQ